MHYLETHVLLQDLYLYDEESNSRAEVRSSNLNSQLGQVRFIISDKTGTLTQNKMCFKMCSVGGVKYVSSKMDKFKDEKILKDLKSGARNAEAIREFLTLLAICHTVVPEKVTDPEMEQVVYHSPSPDELALIKCARDHQFVFHTRTPLCVYIQAMGKEEKYDILQVLEFTSSRKRMGVIVRCPDQKLKLYIKGANLRLLGASAIEDKLQEGVKETIEHVIEAGIMIWVLTGDKLETAQNIGYSCGLIDPFVPILVLSEETPEATADKIKIYLKEFMKKKIKISLIVSGESLRHALQKRNKMRFMHLASLCSTVICCRCSPMQKAAVVKLIQNWSDGTVLAIGDGANDVAMIQAADIGVGISGEEGMQASLAADYSIAQFRYLERLVFVHGAINYHRVTKTILYFFYKNVVQATVMFFYVFYTLFADTSLFDGWSVVMFNIFFTSWPPLAMGIWDRLLPFDLMMNYPALYQLSQSSEGFSLKIYFIWMFTGFVHAAVIFFIALATFKEDVFWRSGRSSYNFVMGTAVNIAVVVVVNLKAVMETDSITIMSWIAFFGSIIMLFIYLFSYSLTSPASPMIKVESAMADTILHVFSSYTVVAYLIFVILLSLSFDLLVRVFQRSLYRTIRDEVVSHEFDVKQFNDLYYPLVKVKEIVAKASESALSLVNIQSIISKQRGYSFAQDEQSAVPQGEVIRLYDSRMPKTPGSPLERGSLRSSGSSKSKSKDEKSGEEMELFKIDKTQISESTSKSLTN